MKTDIHVHLIPPELASGADAPVLGPEALEARCRSGGAERAVIQGWPFRSLEDCRVQNQAILQALRTRPDFFRGFCAAAPGAGAAARRLPPVWAPAAPASVSWTWPDRAFPWRTRIS